MLVVWFAFGIVDFMVLFIVCIFFDGNLLGCLVLATVSLLLIESLLKVVARCAESLLVVTTLVVLNFI